MLDFYIDADFMGIWRPITLADPSSVKSRTWYVSALLWASKLQLKWHWVLLKQHILFDPKQYET